MGKASVVIYRVPKQQYPSTYKIFFFLLPISLALTTFLLIFIYIHTTSSVFTNPEASPFLEPTTNSSLFDLIIPFSNDNETIPFSIDNTAEDLFFDLPRTASYAKQSQWSLGIGDLFGFTGMQFFFIFSNLRIYVDR